MLYCKDRGSRHGGGVALCVRDYISSESLVVDINDVDDVACVCGSKCPDIIIHLW